MQVQGSGKVSLPDGQMIRLAYAEQNGHPFIPPVRAAAAKSGTRTSTVLTRGLEIALPDDDSEEATVGQERGSRNCAETSKLQAALEGGGRAPLSPPQATINPWHPRSSAWSNCYSRETWIPSR